MNIDIPAESLLDGDELALAHTNQALESMTAQERLCWEKGYESVGDTHTSRPIEPGMSEEQSRFFGLTRECGLHL